MMDQQQTLNIISVAIGFMAAIFFCIGNAFNSSKQIINQASTYWDFNESLARALAAQRAQYVVGAILLLISFGLQVAAIQASPTIPANLPQFLHTWQRLVLFVLFSFALLAGGCSFGIYRQTRKKIESHMAKVKKGEV